MATVSDNFNRADNPTSLGTATTGQVWTQVAAQGAGGMTGNPYGILDNEGFNAGTGGDAGGDSLVVVETGMRNTRGEVRLMNATAGSVENLRNQGITIKYVDDTHYIFLTYARAFGGLFRLYIADGGTALMRGPDCFVSFADGDTIGYAICGNQITAYHNGEVAQNYPITFSGGDVLSATLLAGTKCGLQAAPGTSTPGTLPVFESFLIEDNSECQTFDCDGGDCVLNTEGTGEFNSLAACQASCGVEPSYNCVDGVCCDPGDGSGTYATVELCQASCSTASASPSPEPCTPPEGEALSCVTANGQLIVTLRDQDNQQIAYAWHEGSDRMPISSMTNWKRSMRALTLLELGVAFETDNNDPLNPMVVSVHRNLRANYIRDGRVGDGSNRVDSETAPFDDAMITDGMMMAVFGHNIGGEGIHYILGRMSSLGSPSSSPSPSSSLSASPSSSFSVSPSRSPSLSPSTSHSGSVSPSHSPSASVSVSPSRSISASPSVTTSASPSVSVSRSPSASPSSSGSASASAS